jgi:spore maturation protein CgeB
MGKITIDMVGENDFLFPGMIHQELQRHEFDRDVTIFMEPNQGDIYFSQDWGPTEHHKFVFYALPSLREGVTAMMGESCALVSYAADPAHHHPQKGEKLYDIGFVGKRYYPDRNGYLDMLVSHYPTSFANYDQLPRAELPNVLSKCKVLFNHTRPEIDVNLRFFESMALGCQVMLRTPGLKEFAREGVHYMGYSSHEECVEVIKRLLEDDDLREKIALQARSHFLTNHTYTHRATAIINHLREYYERLRV